jgi:hypothetical protein
VPVNIGSPQRSRSDQGLDAAVRGAAFTDWDKRISAAKAYAQESSERALAARDPDFKDALVELEKSWLDLGNDFERLKRCEDSLLTRSRRRGILL